jgi:excisionase family DNA binding protein
MEQPMPKKLLSPDEVASILRVDPGDVLTLIEERTLRAYKIGTSIVRIDEDDLERCLEASATGVEGTERNQPPASALARNHPQPNEWMCKTFAGRTTFRVSGHVDTGAQIWPGNIRYPISFPKEKLDALLAYGRSRGEMKVGLSFDRPEEGSLGQWIQENLPTKMNPACYVGGLLIDEGYAERPRAGVIRFLPRRRT